MREGLELSVVFLTGMKSEADTLGAHGTSRDDVVVLCGSDARDHLEELLSSVKVDGILSYGVCGSLAPQVRVGDVFLATGVLGDFVTSTSIQWLTNLRKLVSPSQALPVRVLTGKTYSSSVEVADTAASKAALLAKSDAWCVDQISYAVARWARLHGKPWVVVGTASDAHDQPVTDWPNVLGPDGRVSLPASVEDIVSNPQDWPEVATEAVTAARALRSLGTVAGILAANNWGLERS